MERSVEERGDKARATFLPYIPLIRRWGLPIPAAQGHTDRENQENVNREINLTKPAMQTKASNPSKAGELKPAPGHVLVEGAPQGHTIDPKAVRYYYPPKTVTPPPMAT